MNAQQINTPNWQQYVAVGSSAVLEEGTAARLHDSPGPPRYWFSGDTTIVLGAGNTEDSGLVNHTLAHWEIRIAPHAVRAFGRGFLVVACLRLFGGLHSPRENSRVDIWLNEEQIDGFALRVVPQNHSDFFHRPPLPDVEVLRGFRDCQTIYAWPIRRALLSADAPQRVTVRIDHGVRWDIDFVAVLLQPRRNSHRVFLSHSWADKVIARTLAEQLAERNIPVWVDEDEMNIGDSLIEKIREAIDTVEYVVVLLSETSVQSEWVRREVDVAMNQEISGRRVKVLPVRLDQCTPPGFLLGKVYADLQRPEQMETVVSMIERRVRT